jgi:hypothetical protein
MANYPDWVLAHKKKGTYINYVNGKYYLYAAHSERISGTNKVRRVSDGYIGRITEEGGLIPARDKVTGDVIVYAYGLHMTALALSEKILLGLKREFRGAAERLLVMGILLATGWGVDDDSFNASFLSRVFPEVDLAQKLTEKQRIGAERCTRMVADKLFGATGGDVCIQTKLSRVYMVVVNNKEYLSKKPDGIEAWLIEHGIEWRGL